MDKSEYITTTNAVFSHSPAGHGNLVEFTNYTNDGVVAIAKDDVGILGFGIASGITPTQLVLSAVAELNQLMSYGHYWLAEGADNDHWSLVCGFKFAYELINPQFVIELASGLANYSGSIIDVARQKLGETPHQSYWLMGDASPETKAFVLLGHLG
jgi:hypothetical protein